MIPDDLIKIDASRFELSKRLNLYEDPDGDIIFLVNRKSRFIMKDTELFLERAVKIKEVTRKLPKLLISAPLCSKSKAKLESEGVTVVLLGQL